jgi:hypothetical protein
MSLFDMLKDKASELLGGATDKVTEMTGFESPADAVGGVTDAGQGVVDSATGVIGDAAGSITDHLPGTK